MKFAIYGENVTGRRSKTGFLNSTSMLSLMKHKAPKLPSKSMAATP